MAAKHDITKHDIVKHTDPCKTLMSCWEISM